MSTNEIRKQATVMMRRESSGPKDGNSCGEESDQGAFEKPGQNSWRFSQLSIPQPEGAMAPKLTSTPPRVGARTASEDVSVLEKESALFQMWLQSSLGAAGLPDAEKWSRRRTTEDSLPAHSLEGGSETCPLCFNVCI